MVLDEQNINIEKPIRKYDKIKCEHNKRKSRCKECGGSELCDHNKLKYQCKECGGSRICEHNKRKAYCKDCGGSSLCEHNKRKSRCKECGGSELCDHNKLKSQCKDCDGARICEHKKQKSCCKECGGISICEHNKRKYDCKECDGSRFCEHKKDKRFCKECGGSGLCIHEKLKRFCKECGGSGLCIHKIAKAICKECDGSSICEHNKSKYVCRVCNHLSYCIHNKLKKYCKECDGHSLCIHNKLKRYCKECDGCDICKTPLCYTFKNKKYDGHCFVCYVNLFPDKPNSRNYKTKERSVTEFILNTFSQYTWTTDKKIEDGCSQRRPDLLLDLGYQVIIVEIDETQHRNYEEICNNRRTMEISKDLNHRPIIFIRFNPDAYKDSDGKLINSCWKINKDGLCSLNKKSEWSSRLDKLKLLIEFWCDENNKSEKTIEVEHLFFDECSTESESDNSFDINTEESNQNITKN